MKQVTEALGRYHEYAQTELAKGVSELEMFSRQLEEKKTQLRVEATVGEERESET